MEKNVNQILLRPLVWRKNIGTRAVPPCKPIEEAALSGLLKFRLIQQVCLATIYSKNKFKTCFTLRNVISSLLLSRIKLDLNNLISSFVYLNYDGTVPVQRQLNVMQSSSNI